MMASTPETSPSSTSHIDFNDSGIATKGRLPNEDRWVDLDNSNNSLSAESFIYGEIILDLGSQLEMEGKVRTT